MVNPNNRLILSVGNRRDVEQMGVSLTTLNDVLVRSFASSALFFVIEVRWLPRATHVVVYIIMALAPLAFIMRLILPALE